MPHFRLETNIPKSKVTPEVLKNLSKAVAKTLGKPESVNFFFNLCVTCRVNFYF